jgi:hypothetical protein
MTGIMGAVQVSDTIDALMEAATIPGDDERLARIRQLVTEDFVFVNPGFIAEGPDALARTLGRFMGFLGNAIRVVRTSEVDQHHGHFRYTWARHRGDQIEMEGCDFGWADEAGRLKRLVVFDHILPPELG